MLRHCCLLVTVLFCACAEPVQQQVDYRYPAEWEPHQAIWIGCESDSPLTEFEATTMKMISELTRHVRVTLVVNSDSTMLVFRDVLRGAGVDSSQVKFITQKDAGFFYRDAGPLFLVNDSGDQKVADMLWTDYGNVPLDSVSERGQLTEKLDEEIAQYLGLETVPSKVVMEGGAIEVNGQGTIILVEEVTLRRNQHLTKAEIEEDILRTLGQMKVIWLKEGPAEDPHQIKRLLGNFFGFGTGGHVDEFCRFANDSTILLGWVGDSEREFDLVNQLNYQRMSVNFDILSQATDQDGKRFKIVKVPIPELQFTTAELTQSEYDFIKPDYPDLAPGDTIFWVAASSYLNYVITNGMVLIPAYWEEGLAESVRLKDDQVLRIFEKQFSDREIVQLNPIALNYYGGGMHCMTQQQPK